VLKASQELICVLETIERLLSDIMCTLNTILIATAPAVNVAALTRVHELLDGYIVTFHAGCNQDDEHVAYERKSPK
jgi:hypothetical protein